MTRPKLVLLPGWAHPADSLAPLAARLGPSFDTHLPIFPSAVSETALPWLEANVSSPVIVLGWSLGGMIALQAAIRRPDLVAGLILVGTTPRFCAAEGWPHGAAERAVRALAAALRTRPEPTLRQFFADTAFPLEPADPAGAVAAALAMGVDSLRKDLQYLQLSDWREGLKSVKMPALVLHGRLDRVIPQAAGLELARLLPRAKFVGFDDAGHALPAARPDAVASAASELLRELT